MKGWNKKVKWIMIQAAKVVIRTDPRTKAFYERKLKRHNHNVAMTHVANKMLRIVWHMLRESRLYKDRKEHLYQSNLERMAHIAQ
jgi:hypothetical protein